MISKSYSMLRGYWQWSVSSGGGVIIIKGMATGRFPLLQWKAQNPDV